ncbi:MAG TPA: alpha/beta hydrolase [Gaiellaceae bacterium]|nr:alpha/beta hydrolase [Gaiellaceae bacterium]
MRSFLTKTRSGALFVYEWGDAGAPVVLYWDGLGGTGLHANELAPVVVERFGARVIAPDPPGHGRSQPVSSDGYRPTSLASTAADLLSTLGVEEGLFVGFSWGAEVAVAFGARHAERTSGLVLVDGGYWDFSDLPGFDIGQGLEVRIDAARKRAEGERYPSWEAYFEAERKALGRWTPELQEAHRAAMREQGGLIVPIAGPEVVGAISHGNCVEPTAGWHDLLAASGIPVLLVTPAEGLGPVSVAGIERFRANVPQLEVVTLPGEVHDLVSAAPAEVAELVGARLG